MCCAQEWRKITAAWIPPCARWEAICSRQVENKSFISHFSFQ
jgi:hypothetical protein